MPHALDCTVWSLEESEPRYKVSRGGCSRTPVISHWLGQSRVSCSEFKAPARIQVKTHPNLLISQARVVKKSRLRSTLCVFKQPQACANHRAVWCRLQARVVSLWVYRMERKICRIYLKANQQMQGERGIVSLDFRPNMIQCKVGQFEGYSLTYFHAVERFRVVQSSSIEVRR